MDIDVMKANDWTQVAEIYRCGIETGNATFETEVPTWTHWDQNHMPDFRLVGRIDDEIVGWAALSQVSKRHVYRGVVEESIYVAPNQQGKGIGKQLLQELISRAENAGIWTIQTGIFPENVASVALHEKCGFRIIGTRERIGQLDGVWRDVYFMERRSTVAGT